jgi:hypothetical protein
MIVKHYYRKLWNIGDWQNVDHIYGSADSNEEVEKSDLATAEACTVSDDEDIYGDNDAIASRSDRVTQRKRPRLEDDV